MANDPIKFIDNTAFHRADAESIMMIELPKLVITSTGDDGRQSIAEPLRAGQQRDCLLLMNYLKFKASSAPPLEAMRLQKEAAKIRGLLVITYQKLIWFAIGRRRHARMIKAGVWDQVLSNANLIIMQEIDEHDIDGEFALSTRLVKALNWRMLRLWQRESLLRGRFRQFAEIDVEEGESTINYVESKEPEPITAIARKEVAGKVAELLKCLPDRWRDVVVASYGIGGAAREKDWQIAKRLRVHRSRVGKIREDALRRLYQAAVS